MYMAAREDESVGDGRRGGERSILVLVMKLTNDISQCYLSY